MSWGWGITVLARRANRFLYCIYSYFIIKTTIYWRFLVQSNAGCAQYGFVDFFIITVCWRWLTILKTSKLVGAYWAISFYKEMIIRGLLFKIFWRLLIFAQKFNKKSLQKNVKKEIWSEYQGNTDDLLFFASYLFAGSLRGADKGGANRNGPKYIRVAMFPVGEYIPEASRVRFKCVKNRKTRTRLYAQSSSD